MQQPKYVVITPVRDEAEFLPRVIESMISQTILPQEWLVVDDGSTDGTLDLLLAASNEHSWIKVHQKPDRGVRSVGPGVVEAFYFGLDRLETQDYDFIAATLMQYFSHDPYLGSASGKIFLPVGETLIEERTADEMTVGAFNFYRRKAFEDIGGFTREVMWDGIAFHEARIHGWRTRSIANTKLDILHKRLMGSSHKSILHGRLRWGRGQYFMGTHPLYIIAIAAYRSLERPFFIGGLSLLGGYIASALKGMKRYGDRDFRKSLHAWQMERLKLGKRLEQIPKSESGLNRSFQLEINT
jgi:biofilm PGA synthesis N-glycosyltransferase PgaC